ncbi:MAG TPA: efflux RND transporter periplasmic adaptor subunit [Fimbriimonadaceae bacterium]|nr:efflux RND transporter periplasmic adaptor subunit [Fimbriimonadaceae bacterium]HRJ97385.1 efflux RND transporter periplasmic adaptor subunit [Fimbriimonadaceae bacterium]
MKRASLLLVVGSLAAFAVAGGPDDGHSHGPGPGGPASSTGSPSRRTVVVSHHDLRIEGADGKPVGGAKVTSTITPKGKPTEIIHTEKNAYEPENQVYSSHMTYTAAGEYVLTEDIEMPDGRRTRVEFPITVVQAAAQPGEAGAEHEAHGPNWLLIGVGIVGGAVALAVAYRLGKRSGAGGMPTAVVFLGLVATGLAAGSCAKQEGEAHVHGPDGRHIMPESSPDAGATVLYEAYATPGKGRSATKVVEGITFTLTIENEVVEADPDLVAIDKAQAETIGLKTAKAELSSSASWLETTGRVSANPNGVVKVNARSSGRVVRLGALPGTTVHRGQVLAEIESPDLADAQAAYRTASAERAQVEAAIRIAQSGVESAETELGIAERNLARQKQLAQAGAFTAPAVETARANASQAEAEVAAARIEVERLTSLLGRQKQGLANGVVAPRDVEETEARLETARSTLADATTKQRLAQAALEREESIADRGLRDAREVEAARAQADLARAALRSAKNRLAQARADTARIESAIRVAADQIRLLGGTPGGGHRIVIASPIDAEVEERLVTSGQTVAVGELLFELLNAAIVWVVADVYEKDIPKVAVGQRIEVIADAYPDKVYVGEVAFVHNEVDPQTRTTPVRIVIDNPGERLKQDMFVRVLLGTDDEQLVLVPTAAVQKDKGLDVAFVRVREGVFRRTLVQVQRVVGNRTVVKGVEPGSVVATAGSYQLMSLGGAR